MKKTKQKKLLNVIKFSETKMKTTKTKIKNQCFKLNDILSRKNYNKHSTKN